MRQGLGFYDSNLCQRWWQMANSIVKNLRLELERIESELARLSAEADHFRSVIAHYEAQGETTEAVQPAKLLRNEIYAVLDTEGQSLPYREIYRRLLDKGITIHGQDPVKNVGAHMSSDDRFESVGGGYWGLAKWAR